MTPGAKASKAWKSPLRHCEHQPEVGPDENALKIKAINLVVLKPFFGRQAGGSGGVLDLFDENHISFPQKNACVYTCLEAYSQGQGLLRSLKPGPATGPGMNLGVGEVVSGPC